MAKPTGRKRGGQPGNRNALKTGLHTRQMRDMRRTARLRIAALKAAAAWANMVLALNQSYHPRRARADSECEGSGPRSINRTSFPHFVMAGLDPGGVKCNDKNTTISDQCNNLQGTTAPSSIAPSVLDQREESGFDIWPGFGEVERFKTDRVPLYHDSF